MAGIVGNLTLIKVLAQFALLIQKGFACFGQREKEVSMRASCLDNLGANWDTTVSTQIH